MGRAMLKRVFLPMVLLALLTSCTAYAAPTQTVPDVFVTGFRMDAYPPLARQASIEGDVTAVLHLSGDGSVSAITDISGPDLLRGEVDVMKTWQFLVPDHKSRQLAVILRYSLKGEPRKDASTFIKASLPYLIEITTNPSPDAIGARRGKRTPDIPKANTCYRCG